MSLSQRGESCGYIVSKYGIDILLQRKTAQGIQSFTKLRQATALESFEASAKSEANAIQIAKAARDAQLTREAANFLSPTSLIKNAEKAILQKEKFTSYALKNNGKVKGFREILGYNESNWQELQEQIRNGILKTEEKYHLTDQYGVKFSVDMYIEGPNGNAIVRTGWIYEPNIESPRLTTLYLIDKKKYCKTNEI